VSVRAGDSEWLHCREIHGAGAVNPCTPDDCGCFPDRRYRRGGGSSLPKGFRKVVPWTNEGVAEEVHFRCPCGRRTVKVTSPPHEIEFDTYGVLTLDGSVGSRASLHLSDGQANWCHFWIRDGVPEMCPDARCPGSKGIDT